MGSNNSDYIAINDDFIKNSSIIVSTSSNDEFAIGRINPKCEFDNPPFKCNKLIMFFCTEGEMVINMNTKEFCIEKNIFMAILPNTIVKLISATDNSCVHFMAIDERYMRNIHITLIKVLPFYIQYYKSPIIKLTDEELKSIKQCYDAINSEISNCSLVYREDIIRSLLSYSIYKLSDIAHNNQYGSKDNLLFNNAANRIFENFLLLLVENYSQEHEVNFYAEKLCVTPKYLSTVVKQISGETVSKWISRLIIKESLDLIVYTKLTIQEIAYKLNFPNPSFFGAYFKKNTGTTPGKFRKNHE